MNWLDPIKELYNMYSEEEDILRIVEVEDDDLDFILDIEGPADPYTDYVGLDSPCFDNQWWRDKIRDQ